MLQIQKSGVFLSALLTVNALAIRAIKIVERDVDGVHATFEESEGSAQLIKYQLDGKTYRVLFPGQDPMILTDGKSFFTQEAVSLKPSIEWQIGSGAKLIKKKDDKVLEKQSAYDEAEERRVRAQLQTHLLSLPREERIGDKKNIEEFLIDSIRITDKPLLPLGIVAGAKVISDGNAYTVAGNKRYPGILFKDGSAYYMPPDHNEIQSLGVREKPPLLTASPVGKKGKEIPASDKAVSAYSLYALDRWFSFPKKSEKALINVIKKGMGHNGEGMEVTFDASTLPKHFREGSFVDENKKPLDANAIQERALNFALNFIGENATAQPAKITTGKDGKKIVDTSPFVSTLDLGRLLRRNPYACTPGEISNVRLDWFLTEIQKDNSYRDVAHVPATLASASDQLGINANFTANSEENMNVGIASSGVANGQRVGNRQLQFKKDLKPFYQTLDFATDEKGKLIDPKADFRKHPEGFAHTAGEYIYSRKNDFPAYAVYRFSTQAPTAGPDGSVSFVFTDAGQSIAAAPDSVVNDGETNFGPFIHNPRSCLVCHHAGLRSATDQTPGDPKDWMLSEKDFNADPGMKKAFPDYKSYEKLVNQFFGKAQPFLDAVEKDTNDFLKALKKSKAFVSTDGKEPESLLPEFFTQYNDNLSTDRAAKELGTDTETLRRILSQDVHTDFGRVKYDRVTGYFTRNDFEEAFCFLKEAIQQGKDQDSGKRPQTNQESH